MLVVARSKFAVALPDQLLSLVFILPYLTQCFLFEAPELGLFCNGELMKGPLFCMRT